jgi:Tfp pilus assembly protein PilF/transcriptional regulator with XRE-family HTH domain
VRDLRLSLGETQQVFANRLHVSRSVIANIETTTPPSKAFLEALIAAFPDLADDLVAVSGPGTVRSQPKPPNAQLERFVRANLRRGSYAEARSALERENSSIPSSDHEAKIWINQTLAHVHTHEGNPLRGTLSLLICARIGDMGACDPQEIVAIYDEMILLALRAGSEDLAHTMLDLALLKHPTAPELWHRKATTHWNAREFSSSDAAFSLADRYRSRRRWVNVELDRGQMLAEWGRPHDALDQLGGALRDSAMTPEEIAYANTAEAFARFRAGATVSSVDSTFTKAATVLRDDGLLYYLRALCYATEYISRFGKVGTNHYDTALRLFALARLARRRPVSRARLEYLQHRVAILEAINKRLKNEQD